ncbi:MAG TPA: hypothetical protein VF790_05105 [Dissulfurispiraceae bacterium]
MKKKVFPFLLLALFSFASAAHAELDFDQEVLVIPDIHNEKPYIWQVARNPKDYELVFEQSEAVAGKDARFTFSVNTKSPASPGDMHVFITDDDLHAYKHLRPGFADGKYTFTYNAPWAGKYRFEIVFKTAQGWVDLKKDVKVSGGTAQRDTRVPGDEDYEIKVRIVPRVLYTEHVVTFLYEILYKGTPVKDIEKVDGSDMELATWDEDLKEFIFATPVQNLGGPEVAVSAVFRRPGKRAVFAEFRHKGVTRKVELVIYVPAEPIIQEGTIESLRPSE